MPTPVHPFVGRDVPWLLRTQAEQRPHHQALIWRDFDGGRRTWTYRELLRDVDTLASGLVAAGIGLGDRIAIACHNRPEFLLALFASLRVGAMVVSINTRLTPNELREQLRRSAARLVVTDETLLPSVVAATDGQQIFVADVVTEGADSGANGVRPLSSLLRPDAVPAHAAVDPLAPAGIQFTSGTSKRPKGVVWTQANFLWAGRVSAAHEGLRPDDVHLTYLPLFHTNAQSYSVMASLWVGATILLVPRFSARWFWPIAVEERATWCSTIPFAIRALLDQEVPRHSFRAWGTGVLAPRWERRFGVPIMAWWGMTETVSHGIVSELGLPVRSKAMGRAATEYGIRVREDDGDVGETGVGSLEVRGERGVSVALGYLDDCAADEATWTDDGWMRTGDRVRLDPDGWITFLDRDADLLRVGAENVAASEIEAAILRVPGVAEVAVVARPDEMLDDVPVAFVLPSDSSVEPQALGRAIDAWCSDNLADFKRPRAVYVESSLPRATLEKVAKGELRREAAERAASTRDQQRKRSSDA